MSKEHARRIHLLVPLAAALVVGAAGPGGPLAPRAGDPPWDPPPCPPGASPEASGAAWYALDPELDAEGWLTGQRLSVGRVGEPGSRRGVLPPESFASGPVGGRLLVGDDDGARSRLRVIDVSEGCATEVGREASVVRSAVLSPEGDVVWEHRVNRVTRVDEGVWRRPLDGGPARRAMRGLDPDPAFGRTFATRLEVLADGRVAVDSCGELACRLRVLDPRTGRVEGVSGGGPLVGVVDGRVIAYAACGSFPCRLDAVDLASGRRTTLVEAAGPAALAGHDGRTVVHETGPGSFEAIDLPTLGHRPIVAAAGWLVPGGSTATSGADIPAGWVLLAPSGHLAGPASARLLDVATGAVTTLAEVQP